MTKPDGRCLEEKSRAGLAFMDWHWINYGGKTTSGAQCPADTACKELCTWESGQCRACPE